LEKRNPGPAETSVGEYLAKNRKRTPELDAIAAKAAFQKNAHRPAPAATGNALWNRHHSCLPCTAGRSTYPTVNYANNSRTAFPLPSLVT
jgi:hypothetical protein